MLPTKDKLKKYGITDNDLCPLCNTESETRDHLFINCKKHIDAWLFVECIIRKYRKNYSFCLTNENRILGTGINTDLCIFLIGRLHRIIWKARCHATLQDIGDCNILYKYKMNLRHFLFMEKERLEDNVFDKIYCKNSALCYLERNIVKFCF